MPIVGLDHVQLAMPAGCEQEARRFYADILGLSEIAKPAPLADRGGCWFEGPGTAVHLGVEADFVPARKAHPAFRVSDLDAFRDRLMAHGVETIPDTSLPGVRRFYVFDPFGNRIECIADDDSFTRNAHAQGSG